MNAKYIGTFTGLTTFENKTTTVKHLFLREGNYYLVEASCQDPVDNLTPIKVERLEPKDVVLTGKLESCLISEFLE